MGDAHGVATPPSGCTCTADGQGDMDRDQQEQPRDISGDRQVGSARVLSVHRSSEDLVPMRVWHGRKA
jgi:hypothetical protein